MNTLPVIQRRPLNEGEWTDVSTEFFRRNNIPLAKVIAHLEAGGMALLADEGQMFEYRLKPE